MAFSFRATTRDDRGRTVEAIDDARLRRDSEGRNSPRSQLARRLRTAVRTRSSEVTPHTLLVIAATVLTGLILARAAPQGYRFGSVIAIAVVGGMTTLLTTRHKVASSLAASAVAEGFCGSCAYTLHGLAAEPDGCVVCSECGSAWRASRIVVPEGSVPLRPPHPHFLQRPLLGSGRTAPMTTDDRGRFVARLDEALRRMGPEARASLPPAERKAIRADLRRAGNRVRYAIAAPSALLTLLFLALALADAPAATLAQTLTRVGSVLLFGGGITAAVLFMEVGLSPAKVRVALLAHGRCPSCGAALDPDRAADGYVVCACGASWAGHDARGTPPSRCAAAPPAADTPPPAAPQ